MDFSSINDAACETYNLGRYSLAEAMFRHVLAETPGDHAARQNLGLTVLAQGRWREGAVLYEARLERKPGPGLPYPRWSGEPLDGKRVLIWPEQGLGDQIMCARYVPALVERGCEVTLICAPTLCRLFAQALPGKVLPAQGTIDFEDPDVWLWSMSLLAAVGDPQGGRVPFLHAAPKASGARIGVATRGSPIHPNDAGRSLPADLAAELLSLSGTMSLLPEHTGVADMLDTAEIIAGLDLVISVDTSIAHLAGAMGKPVWILLPERGPDWRWMRERDDSPWYPAARLFRQGDDADWRPVLSAVRAGLAAAEWSD
ncbi:MAG TPA: glycosyltransferase family 9 protein [Phenylobacterium sp.]|uniref:glycosyltransferase family 9 protein n=1 Tax=Phenylobacterium sp. TaxID=1871053 RepID=UPI002B48FEE2|nr:glycosyltransferase family 9 protein [Phenylobacterium sp.]HKR86876.1 glycosyltransferase family 9 protein [Phenylobacterium sp.]